MTMSFTQPVRQYGALPHTRMYGATRLTFDAGSAHPSRQAEEASMSYAPVATASYTLVQGRGLSAAMPFCRYPCNKVSQKARLRQSQRQGLIVPARCQATVKGKQQKTEQQQQEQQPAPKSKPSRSSVSYPGNSPGRSRPLAPQEH